MALVLVAAKMGLLSSGKLRLLLVVAFVFASVVWIRRGADVVNEDDDVRDRVHHGDE